MSALTEATRAVIWEDGGATFLARIVGADGADITQASITSGSYKVYDLDSSTSTTAVATGSITVNTNVYNELQTDDRWTEDSTGYNFAHTIAATVFTTGDHRYRTEYLFDPASGEDFWLVYEVYAQPVMTS